MKFGVASALLYATLFVGLCVVALLFVNSKWNVIRDGIFRDGGSFYGGLICLTLLVPVKNALTLGVILAVPVYAKFIWKMYLQRLPRVLMLTFLIAVVAGVYLSVIRAEFYYRLENWDFNRIIEFMVMIIIAGIIGEAQKIMKVTTAVGLAAFGSLTYAISTVGLNSPNPWK